MRNHYQQIQAEERAVIMVMRQQNSSVREIARALSRAPSSISREVNRNVLANPAGYDPVRAGVCGEQLAASINAVRFPDLVVCAF